MQAVHSQYGKYPSVLYNTFPYVIKVTKAVVLAKGRCKTLVDLCFDQIHLPTDFLKLRRSIVFDLSIFVHYFINAFQDILIIFDC